MSSAPRPSLARPAWKCRILVTGGGSGALPSRPGERGRAPGSHPRRPLGAPRTGSRSAGLCLRSLEWRRARACQVGRGGERHTSPPFPFSPGDGRGLQRVPPVEREAATVARRQHPQSGAEARAVSPPAGVHIPGPSGMCPSSPESRPVCRSPGGAWWLAPIPGLLAVRAAGLGPGLVNFTLGAAALPGRVGGGSGSVSGACYFWAPWLPGWGWRTAVE